MKFGGGGKSKSSGGIGGLPPAGGVGGSGIGLPGYAKADTYLSSGGSSGSSPKPKRPFESLGKATINLFGGGIGKAPAPTGEEPQPAFKGVPVLEQIAGGLGAISEPIGQAIARVPHFGEAWRAAEAWKQNPGITRDKYESLVNANQLTRDEAEAAYLRELFEARHGPGKADLFTDFNRPTGDYSLGGQFIRGAVVPLALPQRFNVAMTGGNIGTFLGSIARGDFRTPAQQRLDSFRNATDEELNYGAGDEGHPELIKLREMLKAGQISDDQAFTELITLGFGVSNPTGTLESIFNEIGSDPTILLGLGMGSFANITSKASTRGFLAVSKEVGQEALIGLERKVVASGKKLTPKNGLAMALKDPELAPKVEAAIRKNTNKATQWLLLDAPIVERTGRAIQTVLDPLSLFGRDDVARFTAEQFSRKLGSGVVNGFGAANYRRTLRTLTAELGDDVGGALQEGFDRGAMQIGAQVGVEQLITKVKGPQDLAALGDDITASALNSAHKLGKDVGRRSQDLVERTRLRIFPLTKGPGGVEAAMRVARTRAADQLVALSDGRVAREAAMRAVARLDEDGLSLVDFMHYGRVGKDLIAARTQAALQGGLDQIDRVTFIGPRQLTRQVLKDLAKAVKNRNIGAVRGIVEKYDDLYRVYGLDATDDELLRQLAESMDQLEELAPQALVDVANLPPALREFMEKYGPMGYHLGLRPADDVLARPILDKSGRLIGANPWVDLVDGATARQTIGRTQVIMRGLFNNISGSQVIRDAEHRFIRMGAERFGFPEESLRGIFSKIMREASERHTTPRGLTGSEIYIIATENMPKRLAKRITERQLAELVFEAHEGSLRKVGVTQKFTGKLKTGLQPLGFLAERIYPATRFKYNPFFQLQELFETPFFMILRGRLPWEDFKRVWTSAGRKEMGEEIDRTLWAMQQVERRGSFYSGDMIEHSILSTHGNKAINEQLYRSAKLKALMDKLPSVSRMKEWGVARSFQYEQGKALMGAFRSASPDSWANYVRWMKYRSGQANDLDAITNFIYDTVAKANPDSAYAQFGPGALKPAHLGAQSRVSTVLLRSIAYGDDEGRVVKWGKLLQDVKSGKVTADELREGLEKMGADPIYIQRSIDLVTFPEPKDFYKAFVKLGRSEKEVEAIRTSAQLQARLKGISEHEMLSRYYAAAPTSLDTAGMIRGRAYFQETIDYLEGRGYEVLPYEAPEIEQMVEHGRAALPDMSLPDNWREMKVKDLNSAQKKARDFQLARERRAANPEIGKPPTFGGVTAEQGRRIQEAYDRGDAELGQSLQREFMDEPGAIPGFGVPPSAAKGPARFARVERGGKLLHKFGEVDGEDWFRMLEDTFPESVLREKGQWYHDVRRGFLALNKNDPEEAARHIMLFAISQLNTSPVDGMKFVSRALAAFRRGEKLPIDKKFAGLNAAAIRQLLMEGKLLDKGLGQKLIDFSDSLLGLKTRTAGVIGPDDMNPWGPVAGDIWAKRDTGFIDAKMERHIGRAYGGKAKYDPDVGFHVTTRDGDEFLIPKEKITGGAPTDDEYDYIVEFYNQRAREANARAWLGRTDWEPAEMQAMGWFRAKTAFGDKTGNARDAFARNTHSVHWEVAPHPKARFADIYPGQQTPAFTRSPEGFARNRITTPDEIVRLRERGDQLLSDIRNAPRVAADGFDAEVIRGEAWRAVQEEWGGNTFDSHTGKVWGSEAVYHGTSAENLDSILRSGVNRGDWIADVKRAKGYAALNPDGVTLRTRPAHMVGGQEKAPGWISGARIKPERMEILRDPDGVFEPLVPGSAPVGEGPFVTAIADTTAIPIGADEATFNKAFDDFLAANREELEKEGRAIGVFRNEDTGALELDVTVAVPTRTDAEALQLAANRGDGAFDYWTGNGVYAPMAGEVIDGLDEVTAKAVTKDISVWAQAEAQELTGVQVLSRYDGVGTFDGAMSPNVTWEIMGTREDAAAYARAVAYLTQSPTVPVTRRSVLGANAAEGRFHAVEWAPADGAKGATYAEAAEVVRRLTTSDALAKKFGAQVIHFDDGSYGVRAVWRGHTTMDGTIPMAEFRADVPDISAVPGWESNRVVVESVTASNDYTRFADGEEHLVWLRENGYHEVADKLGSTGRDRAALVYERTYRKHAAGDLDSFRARRADIDDGYYDRLGPAADDLDTVYGSPGGPLDVADARDDVLFQRHQRGTLGAIAFDDADRRARIALNARRTNPDTLLHELSHQFAEQGLDPSGRKAILDAYNADVGRRAARRASPDGVPAATTTWTEEVHEWFAKQMIEWVRTGDAPAPHLEPIFGFYSKYLKTVTHKVKASAEAQSVLKEVLGRKVVRESASNPDEVALFNMMVDAADQSARNARDLIHFRTNRSWLERSLNHPYFGMYPLSYMWGKVLPELVEFLMFRPFGVKAPLVGYATVGEVYRAVMLQQEYDPELREYLANNEPALRAIAMLTPGIPWDLPVNSPLWFRRITEALATQQERYLSGASETGIDPTKIDVGRIATDVAGYALNPIRGVENIGDTIGAGAAAPGIVGELTGLTPFKTGESTPLPQEGPALTEPPPVPGAPQRPPQQVQPVAPTATQPTQQAPSPLEETLIEAEQDLAEALNNG